jgi:hypothetical protein
MELIAMKHWIGRWLMGVSIIHTLFALAAFGDVLSSIVERGVFDTVGNDPMTGAVVWFVLFGVAFFICGLAISAIERSNSQIPKSLGWTLLALVVLGIVLMPASGFWLAIPPVGAMLLRRSHLPTAIGGA